MSDTTFQEPAAQATVSPTIASYLDEAMMPMPFCPGCGHRTILQALDRALVSLQWERSSVVIVTDIGCVGLSDRYFDTHAFHGLHGRSITYATGIKLANPDLHVIVLIGDGGCGIGGNHLINAARRNVGVTVLVANNFNFGMTGGQHSVLTPHQAITSTTRTGNPERPLDLCATVGVCGAGFVARSTVFNKGLDELIAKALQHDGFALVDIWELCTAYYAPNNKFGKKAMLELLEFGGWATGILAQNDRPEYARAYHQQVAREQGKATDGGQPLEPRFVAALDRRLKVMIAGAAGGKVRSTGHLLGRGAVLSGLYATQRDDYPVTVMTGHSACEVILDAKPIGYTGITRPDVLIWVAEEGRAKARPRLAAMTPEDRAYVASDLLDQDHPIDGMRALDTQAQVIPLDFDRLAQDARSGFRVRRQNRTLLALGAALRREAWYPFEALEAAARETQREEIAVLNLEALEASAKLLDDDV